MSTRAAELAQLEREASWDREAVRPRIAPGTASEEHALALIDAARDDERAQLEDTFGARRKRARREWRRAV